MHRPLYPFCAIVGQDPMKNALLVNAVDPTIGGVLISGHKGTGKSTAVRALCGLLPALEAIEGCPYHCAPHDTLAMDDACAKRASAGEHLSVVSHPMPFVELPLSATEDRLVGTLHVEHALRTGQRRFEPGLLAAANRGILYVDEVNLLDDHLVDTLLDSAASGLNVVERDGISQVHPARFILVGTMNPEEGDLRPQFLDRFGLCVSVAGVADADDRMELVRRRLAFDSDPRGFAERWAGAESQLASRLRQARERVADTTVSDSVLRLAVELAERAGARGHRAEIALVRTARALAAYKGEPEAQWLDMAEAARLVLPHRIPDARLASVTTLERRVADILEEVGATAARPEDSDDDDGESMQVPGSMAAGSIELSAEKKSPHP